MKQKRLEEAEKMSRSGNNFTHMQVRDLTPNHLFSGSNERNECVKVLQ